VKTRFPRYHRGAALLLFMLVALTAVGAVMVKALNRATASSGAGRDQQALRQAKDALMGYALIGHTYTSSDNTSTYAIDINNLPGYLPCPDSDGDGKAEPNCGLAGQSSIGFLPWLTLGLPPLRDSAGSCLWYAVSGDYKAAPQGASLSDATGQLLVFDAALNPLSGPANGEAALALVFAPGKALAGQSRAVTPAAATPCGSNNAADNAVQARNFLDTLAGVNNADGSYAGLLAGVTITPVPSAGFSAFISAATGDTFNDALTILRPGDFQLVYHRMQQWVGGRARQCLAAYQAVNAGKLPWPAELNPLALPVYSDNNAAHRFGRIPSTLAVSAAAGLTAAWPADPQQPASPCFAWSWWPDFRESVFYGIDRSIAPTGVAAPPVLSVDAVPVTGVVLVAGRAIGLQNRATAGDKGGLANYLENANSIDGGTGLIPPGDEAFINGDNSANFNDYACTLDFCPK
jgi:hypothetical protein